MQREYSEEKEDSCKAVAKVLQDMGFGCVLHIRFGVRFYSMRFRITYVPQGVGASWNSHLNGSAGKRHLMSLSPIECVEIFFHSFLKCLMVEQELRRSHESAKIF